ncbi:MAG: hypothetical protein DWB42_10135 [Chloroflexi bacterium]|nr:hypothetical protein [Chloroflexota bacterium]
MAQNFFHLFVNRFDRRHAGAQPFQQAGFVYEPLDLASQIAGIIQFKKQAAFFMPDQFRHTPQIGHYHRYAHMKGF